MLYLDELIHQVVQDLAMDGSLGADASYLRDFIEKTVPNLPSSSTSSEQPLIDDAFLNYSWRILVAVPCIQVILLESPLEPAGRVPALVSQPKGEPTQKEKAKLNSKKRGARVKIQSAVEPEAEPYVEPVTILREDGEIPRSDLRKLRDAHGDLVRIRVDAEERYHTLTGTYTPVSSLTVLSLRTLQLVAKSRANGITGQDITRVLHIEPKSMHHYVKTLMQLKLVEKIPVQQGGTRTNLVVLRRYLHDNEHYRAWNPTTAEESIALPSHAREDGESDSGADDDQRKIIFAQHQYPPMSFAQLGSGVLFKKRLIEILDSGLHNNTLRNKGLFQLTGYHGQISHSERRLRRRHIQALIRDGIVEQFQVLSNHGSRSVRVHCLRLTKYSGHNAAAKAQEIPAAVEEEDEDMDDVDETTLPAFNPLIGVSTTRTLEYSLVDAVCNEPADSTGVPGLSYTGLSERVGQMSIRTADNLISRMEQTHTAPHLSDKSLAVITETIGRQRQLRIVTTESYRQWCLASDTPLDQTRYPPTDPSAGSFGDLSHRQPYTSQKQYNHYISSGSYVSVLKKGKAESTGPPKKRGRPKKVKNESEDEARQSDEAEPVAQPTKAKAKREADSDSDVLDLSTAVQSSKKPQGRPRKFIFVFHENQNKRRRDPKRGEIALKEGYPENVIFIKSIKSVVLAPDGWTGHGTPPKVTAQMKANARSMDDFYKDPIGSWRGTFSGFKPEEDDEAEADEVVVIHEPPKKKAKTSKDKALTHNAHAAEVPSVVPIIDLISDTEHEPEPVAKQAEAGGRKRKQLEDAPVEPEAPPPKRGKKSKATAPVFTDETASHAPVISPPPTEVAAPVAPSAPPQQAAAPITAAPPPHPMVIATNSLTANARVSFTDVAKMNEILQCLRDSGGLWLKLDMNRRHQEWAQENVGKQGPFYPQVAVHFDAKTAKRLVERLINKGEVRERKVHVATNRPSDPLVEIIFVTGTPEEEILHFIRRLGYGHGNRHMQVLHGPGARQAITVQVPFAEAAVQNGRRGKRTREAVRQEKELGLSQDDITARRMIMRERYTVAQQYGYMIGVAARARTLHREILRILTANAAGVVSASERIFVLSALFEEMTARGFLSVVPVSVYKQDLVDFLARPENAEVLMKDLDPAISPGKTIYDQARIGSVIAILVELGFVEALDAVEHSSAQITVRPNGVYANHFKVLEHRQEQVSTYYRFSHVVSIYHLATAREPLLGSFVVQSSQDLDHLWALLQVSCQITGRVEVNPALKAVERPVPATWSRSKEIRSLLIKHKSWMSEFKPNASQREALKQAIDWTTGVRLVKNSQELNALCYKVLMTPQAVAEYLVNLEFAAKEKLRRSREAAGPMRRMQQATSSARKKISAREDERRGQWLGTFQAKAREMAAPLDDDMLEKLADHRETFISRRGDLTSAEVEQELRRTIEGVPDRPSTSKSQGKRKQAPLIAPRRAPVAVTQSPTPQPSPPRDLQPAVPRLAPLEEHEILDLRVHAKEKGESGKQQRNRHHYTDEDLDLLLDAEAVTRSRGRGIKNGHRGHQPLTQVFVGFLSNSLHHNLKRHRSRDAATASYYERLEEAWHQIYIAYRGTEALPDPEPGSLDNFDLNYYINFLRKHVNKAALRIEAPSAPPRPQIHQKPREVVHLPSDVDQLLGAFKVEPPSSRDTVQEYWRSTSDEQRVSSLARSSFTTTAPSANADDAIATDAGVVDALLKMIVGTSEDDYNEQAAVRLLAPFGESVYETEIQRLVNRGVFSRVAGRSTESRKFGFHQHWLKEAVGPCPEQVQLDAEALDYKLAGQPSTVWPVIGKEGEVAALMTLVSAGAVDVDVDLKSCTVLRRPLDDHGTRSITDAETEATLTVTPIAPPLSPLVADVPLEVDAFDASVETLTTLVRSAGRKGVIKSEIFTAMPQLDHADLCSISRAPGLVWTGYDNARLVHEDNIASWLVTVYPQETPNEPIMVPPRKWTDVWGNMMESEWQKAVRLAVGHVMNRPGQTERHLRTTLLPFLDRPETNAVLSHLVTNKIARRAAIEPKHTALLSPVEQTDVSEEELIYWVMDPDTMWRRGQEDVDEE